MLKKLRFHKPFWKDEFIKLWKNMRDIKKFYLKYNSRMSCLQAPVIFGVQGDQIVFGPRVYSKKYNIKSLVVDTL